ncbi:site-specific integrase [Christensenellaceae bacterium OttesenSCG-928-L17]|nr:site-specific integrase [Christensenellaceae bacterium OttesenSCG-928-L17]
MPPKKPIKEKTDKRYRAKITVGHDVDGEPIVKYVSGKTKKELEYNKSEARRHYIEGIEVAKKDISFFRYMTEWYEAYKQPHIGESANRNYRTWLSKYILPAFEDRQLRAIRSAELQGLLNSVSHMSRTAVTDMYSLLRGAFAQATVDGIIPRNPTTTLRKTYAERTSRRSLTSAETEAALKVAGEHPDGLIISLYYHLGLRRGEALGLRWEDIDFAERLVHVRRSVDSRTNQIGGLKTKTSRRSIPTSDELLLILMAQRGIGKTYVIHAAKDSSKHMCKTPYENMWKNLMQAMYEADKSIEHTEEPAASILTAHYFRHNFATLCYYRGVDMLRAHRWLGHADVTTTMRIYTHLDAEKEATNETAEINKVAKRLPAKK